MNGTQMRDPQGKDWQDLRAELDRWAAAERVATLWWRDDDAVKPGPILDRLAETAAGAPVSLAVIPALADPGLQAVLDRNKQFSVIQHGYAHRNHAETGEKKSEFPATRRVEDMLHDLNRGRERLFGLFGARFRPALAPPWNRIADPLATRLPEAGLSGLSTYRRADRPGGFYTSGPRRWVDTHCDIVAWRTTRGFVGDEAALGLITGHLRARRLGDCQEEATGVMTHHIVHDEDCWSFLTDLAAVIDAHPAAAWCDPFADLAAS